MPPNLKIIAVDSVKLATLTPHFFPIAMEGSRVQSGFIINASYLKNFPLNEKQQFDWDLIFKSRELTSRLFKQYDPDLLILPDASVTSLTPYLESSADVPKIARVFNQDGFSAFRITR